MFFQVFTFAFTTMVAIIGRLVGTIPWHQIVLVYTIFLCCVWMVLSRLILLARVLIISPDWLWNNNNGDGGGGGEGDQDLDSPTDSYMHAIPRG